jgi:predicted short-subunit dehydrogenase-like oxidoreductase (DUF2520 family)
MKVVIIGSGNVAWHLAKIVKEKSHQLLQIVNLHSGKISAQFDRFNTPYVFTSRNISQEADIYLIAVKDSELANLQLPIFKEKQILLHTSGNTSIEVLKKFSNNYGCCYPLQTFTKGIDTDFSNIPLILESSNVYTKNISEQFATTLSNHQQYLSIEKRQILHANAVIVNNFTNHLFSLSQDFLKEKNIDFSLLIPLIRETVNKLEQDTAYNNQTGPARRNDANTLAYHKELLKENINLLNIYEQLSDSIIQYYHKDGDKN